MSSKRRPTVRPAMSTLMICGGDPEKAMIKGEVETGEGFGLAPGVVFDTHFMNRGRLKRLFSITAANVGMYADKLPEGAKALFAKYPDYRMDVYPTHRSAAAPAWIYDNIARNPVTSLPIPSATVAFCSAP